MIQPFVVGLIGGVASGKSTVAKMLAARGGLWLDSDRTAHEVLRESAVLALIRGRFGDQVLQADGQVDRQQLASRVFGTDENQVADRKWLEQLIHPRVRERTEARIEEQGSSYPFVVIDAPLLLEAGWGERCDRIVFVDMPLKERQAMAAARGWDATELARREASQLPLEQKRARATDIVSNHGSLVDLENQIDLFVQRVSSHKL